MIKVFTKGSNSGFRVKIGAFYFRYFIGKGCRFEINFNSDFWIKLFGFNSKHYDI